MQAPSLLKFKCLLGHVVHFQLSAAQFSFLLHLWPQWCFLQEPVSIFFYLSKGKRGLIKASGVYFLFFVFFSKLQEPTRTLHTVTVLVVLHERFICPPLPAWSGSSTQGSKSELKQANLPNNKLYVKIKLLWDEQSCRFRWQLIIFSLPFDTSSFYRSFKCAEHISIFTGTPWHTVSWVPSAFYSNNKVQGLISTSFFFSFLNEHDRNRSIVYITDPTI